MLFGYVLFYQFVIEGDLLLFLDMLEKEGKVEGSLLVWRKSPSIVLFVRTKTNKHLKKIGKNSHVSIPLFLSKKLKKTKYS